MSSNTSPAHHRFSGDYDAFYDPEFTAEISNKMRVPQKISVVDQDEYKLIEDMGPNKLHFNDAAYMHVPDRILVRGGNQHVEGRDPLPETRLEQSLVGSAEEAILLSTPPRTLTLDMHAYPAVDMEDENNENRSTLKFRRKTTLSKLHNGDISFINSGSGPTTPPGVLSTDDELSVLKKQIRNVSRRLVAVEQENQQRQQREVVLYSVGLLYFLLKGLFWLNRNW
ncbi:unnamed protein product [Ixodes hexagonus]